MTGGAHRSTAFIAVSAVCLATHNGVMIAGDAAGLPLALSLGLSFLIVVVAGYLGHSRYTYREPLERGRFLRYVAAMATNLPVAFITVWLARDFAGLPMIVAAPLSTVISIGINFVLSRWAIVRTPAVKD